jgi:hypothetical protein
VTCTFSKEALALLVEGDLTGPAVGATEAHLRSCAECRDFLDELRARQAVIKSLRGEVADASECAGMRRDVMAIISARREGLGWALRIERAIMLAFRRHSYALAAFALFGVASVTTVAQIRWPRPSEDPPVFESQGALIRPDGYRGWIAIRQTAGPHPSGVAYVSPAGYRAHEATGTYPDGTMMIWESAESSELLASVKDSTRFGQGWGFFDFRANDGSDAATAEPLPESRGCGTCHQM